jgi:hypothetical protein
VGDRSIPRQHASCPVKIVVARTPAPSSSVAVKNSEMWRARMERDWGAGRCEEKKGVPEGSKRVVDGRRVRRMARNGEKTEGR